MIANNGKKQIDYNEHLDYVNNKCTEIVTAQSIFSRKKLQFFFQNSTGQVKIKLHATIGRPRSHVVIHRSYKLSNIVRFFRPTMYTVNHKKGGSTFVIITLENLDGF